MIPGRYRSALRRNLPLVGTNGSQFATWDFGSMAIAQTQSVSGQDTSPQGIYVKEDGLRLYLMGNQGNDINEYSMSSRLDLSTLSLVDTFSISGEETIPRGCHISDDGTYLFTTGTTSQEVIRYTMSTPWNLTTCSYGGTAADVLDVSGTETAPAGVTFNSDLTVMLLIGTNNDRVFRWDLSSGGDLSTASYTSQSGAVTAQESTPRDIHANPSGGQLVLVGEAGDEINLYSMSSFDPTSLSHVGAYDVSTQDENPTGIWVAPEADFVLVSGSENDSIYKYSL